MAGGRERAGSKSRERRGAGDDLSIIWSLFGRNLFRAPGAWEPVQQASRDRARHDTLSVQSFILQCVFRSSWLQCFPHRSYHSTLQSSLLLSASCLTLSPVRYYSYHVTLTPWANLDVCISIMCFTYLQHISFYFSKTPAPSNLKRARLGTQGEPRGSSTLHPSIEASAKPRMSTSETALAALTSTRLLLLTISEHPRLLSCIPIILCPSMSGGRRNPGSLQRIGCLLLVLHALYLFGQVLVADDRPAERKRE